MRRTGARAVLLEGVLMSAAVIILAALPAGVSGEQDKAPAPAFATLAPAEAPIVLSFRSLRPGEAVLASLRPDARVKRVVLTLGNQIRVLEPASPYVPRGGTDGTAKPTGEAGGSPFAFLGIDLGNKFGTLMLKAEVEHGDGTKEALEIPLEIAPRTFPSAQIQVPPATTNPPKEVLESIRREAELVAEVLGRVSPDWLADGPFQSPLPAFEPFPNFGQQRIYNKTVASVHAGVDIAAPRGTKAVASNSGRVVLANRLYYSGWTVIIDHGRGVFTYCCHFDRVLVKRGETVLKGQAIAEVGSTGRSTGPHLHWSVRILSARVDPFSLVALPL